MSTHSLQGAMADIRHIPNAVIVILTKMYGALSEPAFQISEDDTTLVLLLLLLDRQRNKSSGRYKFSLVEGWGLNLNLVASEFS